MLRKFFGTLWRWSGGYGSNYGSTIDAASYSIKTKYAKQERNILNTLEDSRTAVYRMRSEYRNNEFFSGPIDRLASWVVGENGVSVIFNSMKKSRRAERDLDIIRAEWRKWSMGRVDGERSSNLYKLQHSITTSSILDGFLFFEILNDSETGDIIIKTHDSDRLAIYLNEDLDNGHIIRLGCEYNRQRVKVAHYFRKDDEKTYPWKANYADTRENTVRYSINEMHILYVPKTRGMPFELPELLPIFLRGRDFKDYQDAEMEKQKIASSMVAMITTDAPEEESPLKDLEQSPRDNVQTDFAPQRNTDYLNMPRPIMQYLREGESVTVPPAPTLESYSSYVDTNLTMLAMCLGVSKVTLTLDFAKSSFSSSRMAKISNQPKLGQIRSNLIKTQLLNVVVQEFIKNLYLRGKIELRAMRSVTWQFVDPMAFDVDPVKAAKAKETQLANGMTSLSSLLLSSGLDPETEFAKIAEEREKYPELFKSFNFVNSESILVEEETPPQDEDGDEGQGGPDGEEEN